MTITLPDEMREELERKAKLHGFATVDDYIAEVLRADWFVDGAEAPVPEELQIKSRADLEAKLLEGLNSGPPIRVTPEFWAKLRQRARTGSDEPARKPQS